MSDFNDETDKMSVYNYPPLYALTDRGKQLKTKKERLCVKCQSPFIGRFIQTKKCSKCI